MERSVPGFFSRWHSGILRQAVHNVETVYLPLSSIERPVLYMGFWYRRRLGRALQSLVIVHMAEEAWVHRSSLLLFLLFSLHLRYSLPNGPVATVYAR